MPDNEPGLVRQVAEFCQQQMLLAKNDTVVVGVSGGPDSLCLLHLLTKLGPDFQLKLTVAHLNHQLRHDQSQADADFVQEIATRWQIPIRIESHNIATLAAQRKQSLEEAARQVRYGFLWRVAAEVGASKIAVGHNADDQVETVLMHFLRGTGLAGLRGMLPLIEIASLSLDPDDRPSVTSPSPNLIRPLLEISREEIEAYCRAHDLHPRQDRSNLDTTFFRNRLRHELIPQLETYNPQIRQVLQRTAKVVAADLEILREQLDQAWQAVVNVETTETIEFNLTSWLNLPLALKRATLRRAVQTLRRSLRDINFEHIESGIRIVETGQTGTKATLPQGLMLTVGYETLTIAPEDGVRNSSQPDYPKLDQGRVVPVKLPGVTPLPEGDWQLTTRLLPGDAFNPEHTRQAEPWEAYLNADVVSKTPMLRTRQPGDIFYPLGLGGHRKKINEFMIDEKIPAHWRDRIPLLVADGEILWVCGYRPDERARVDANTKRILHLKFHQH